MSQTVAAFQRCPRCGNENSVDSFACNFCGLRLKIERIEKVRFFRRIEAEWINPYPWYLKILYLFVSGNKAFWDINHKRSKAPGWLILLFSSLLYGVMGLAFFSHFNFIGIDTYSLTRFLYNLSFFAAFFVFGFVYQLILFAALIWLFTKGANYAVGFTERLETRFGALKEQKEKYKEADVSPFSIYKGGTMLQLEGAYKFKMMLCAFTPFLIINAIKILIVLFAFPTVTTDIISPVFDQMFNARTWTTLDIIDALTIAVWVPILMTLAIRELSNSSTTRVLVPTIIIGVLVAILFYFLRPTIFG
ncbi:MAG: hypothetical protein JSV23_03695 [Promethearchaeota archaeon]|nr:MAG: hypothetical protein JSV23_03695 [Candidatus Lokiarchaeota archaeon]